MGDVGMITDALGKFFLDSSPVPAQDQCLLACLPACLPGEADINGTMTAQGRPSYCYHPGLLAFLNQ